LNPNWLYQDIGNGPV